MLSTTYLTQDEANAATQIAELAAKAHAEHPVTGAYRSRGLAKSLAVQVAKIADMRFPKKDAFINAAISETNRIHNARTGL